MNCSNLADFKYSSLVAYIKVQLQGIFIKYINM